MSKKLVVGQIGCGAFAMDHHGPITQHEPLIARVKWACDTFEKNARAYAEKFKVEKTTASFADVTTDPEVDLVCIATTHDARVPIIESAAQHGKHIFCEKPLALTEREYYQIIQAVRRHGVKLCVDYERRMAPAVVALKREWLRHKADPQRQPWRYVERPRARFLEETVTDFFVRIQDESASYKVVHLDPFHGGGLIVGEAAHWIDLACWLFDPDRPVEVRAWGSARMRYGIHVRFQSGNAVTIIMTPNGTFDYPKELYEIAHDGALFRMEAFVENQYYGRPGPDRELFALERDSYPEAGKEGGVGGLLKKHAVRCQGTANVKDRWTSLLPQLGCGPMLAGLIAAIRNGTKTPCDELDGYRATYLANLAMKSIEINQPLPVPVEKWDYFVNL